eukprot:CAMPEP_0182865660 /NCGR_PEP_ID=MMETSP0034_2-20130328/7805_1 /TAXON_ID=156128 /ORGANISM="Nephroselmis pyriformis, Strain CCMP717" /LENGTH=86 /DNA_ID=CAMNT_0024997971 /DNA_START=67 /DNA_END=327 /DNA_ORIENTATION=+
MTSRITEEEYAALTARAEKTMQAAPWKSQARAVDHTPRMSVGQQKLMYIAPAEGTIPSEFRNQKGIFASFLDKAVELNVNLKSTAH